MQQQELQSPPWWAWFPLLGLEVPVTALAWSLALSQSLGTAGHAFWLYQFLFMAVWCICLLSRLLSLSSNKNRRYNECLIFTKRHWSIILLCVLVTVGAGMWIMLTQLGILILRLIFIPCVLSFIYLCSCRNRAGWTEQDRESYNKNHPVARVLSVAYPAFALSIGAGIPAYFYTTFHSAYGGLKATFSAPVCFFGVLVIILLLNYKSLRKAQESNSSDTGDTGGRLTVIVLFVILCLFVAYLNPWDSWLYYGLATAGALLFVLNRFYEKLSPLQLYTLSWLALAAPLFMVAGCM